MYCNPTPGIIPGFFCTLTNAMKKSIFDDMRHPYRLHYNSCFYNKMRYTVKIRACTVMLCAVSSTDHQKKCAKSPRFFGSSALLPALKSVQNRCEIFNGFYLKFRPIKVYRGALKIFAIKFSIFFSSFFTSILTIGGICFFLQYFFDIFSRKNAIILYNQS